MKHDLNEVYKDFEKENITVLPFRFQHLKSVSLGDEKVVGIDRSKDVYKRQAAISQAYSK